MAVGIPTSSCALARLFSRGMASAMSAHIDMVTRYKTKASKPVKRQPLDITRNTRFRSERSRSRLAEIVPSNLVCATRDA
eukprot:1173059-Prorocentrum_minimum.AAC.2